MYKLFRCCSSSSMPSSPGVCCATGQKDSNDLNLCSPALCDPYSPQPPDHLRSRRIAQVDIVAVALWCGALRTTMNGHLQITLPSILPGEPSLFACRPAHANRAHVLNPYDHRTHPRPLGTAPDQLCVPPVAIGRVHRASRGAVACLRTRPVRVFTDPGPNPAVPDLLGDGSRRFRRRCARR
jgi:hypothetical protein